MQDIALFVAVGLAITGKKTNRLLFFLPKKQCAANSQSNTKMLNKSSVLFKMEMDVGSAIFPYRFEFVFFFSFHFGGAAFNFFYHNFRLSWHTICLLLKYEKNEKKNEQTISYCFLCGTSNPT